MRVFARVDTPYGYEMVVEIIEADRDIRALYHSAFVATLIEVTDRDPMPAQWWTYDGESFHPPAGA